MRYKKNLKVLLNLNTLDYSNLTFKIGCYDIPYIKCTKIPPVDYIASFNRPCTYHMTRNTCVAFCEYDKGYDGLCGLWNAIYYNIEDLQAEYLERFKGVKCFIAPDYSQCGDAPEIENIYRHYKSRIVSIWLTMNLHAIVIPLVSCANEIGMQHMLDGMEDCCVVAFNTTGALYNNDQLKIFKKSIQYTVDKLHCLKRIIVYSESPNIEMVKSIFQYAIDANIEIIIPNNIVQTRNKILGED